MRKRRIALAVGIILGLAVGIRWFWLQGLNSRPPLTQTFNGTPPPGPATAPTATSTIVYAEVLNALLSIRAGQITGGDVEKYRTLLLNRSSDSRFVLQRSQQSSNRLERLIAFRLLLESDGWSPALRDTALADSFVLLRAEAADWLYLANRFQDHDDFLALAVKNGALDFAVLNSSLPHLRWKDLPAGAEIMGVGRGIDHYFVELLRRSDLAASLAERDLLTATSNTAEQQTLLQLLHLANRPDYESLLRQSLARSAEDTPVRFQTVWLLGHDFSTPATRTLLTGHLATYPNDPLQSRVQQAIALIDAQVSTGQDRLAGLETRLALALDSGIKSQVGPALVDLLNEALRQQRISDKSRLESARQELPSNTGDYASKRRLADIAFLIWKK